MNRLSTIIQRLDERGKRQPLMPVKVWDQELESRIESLDWGKHKGETAVIALMAGLHLRNDSLDLSHSYAQQIEFDATGAYWHGIMHRMEGDFSNSKYWFYMAGGHPAMAEAAQWIADALEERLVPEEVSSGQIRSLLMDYRDRGNWHPSSFTDLVSLQRHADLPADVMELLEQIQYLETKALFQHTLELGSVFVSS